MKKFFSKAFFVGFLVTLVPSLFFYTLSPLSMIAGGIPEVTIMKGLVIPSLVTALLGGILGQWVRNLWIAGERKRTRGFLIGAGLFFILSFVSMVWGYFGEGLNVLAFLPYLPGFLALVVIRPLLLVIGQVIQFKFTYLEANPLGTWIVVTTSWITWGFLGWVIVSLLQRFGRESKS